MNTKRKFMLRLALVSAVIGTLLAMFQPALCNSSENGDYEWRQILLRFFIFFPFCFVASGLLVFIFKWSRCFFRWFFTWRILKWYLLALGFLLALISLFYAEEDWRGKHAWEKYKHEWEAKGEKFDFASFIPPPVPDDQNFALTPIVASCYSRLLDKNGHRFKPENTNIVNRLEISIYPNYDSDNAPTNGDWEIGQMTDLKAWQAYYRSPLPPVFDKYAAINKFEIAPQPQSPAKDVLLAMSKFDSTIEELRLAGKLRCSRFPLNYDTNQPLNIYLPHLPALRNCVDILKMRAVSELELDQTKKALADVKLALRLQDSIRNEPILISQLVRARLVIIALQPVAEGLVKHQWSDTELLEIDRELEKLDLLTDMQFALRGERARMLATIDYSRRQRNYRDYVGYPPGFFYWNYGTVLGAAAFHLIPSGWFYQVELGIAKTNQQWTMQIVDTTNRLAFPKNEIDPDWAVNVVRPWRLFLADLLSLTSGHDERRIVYVQESVDMARVGCALERCRLALGEYPETLGALSPRFIGTIPDDIIGGQPLHYHRADNGRFVLYSVGWNEKDDGGEFVKEVIDGELDLGNGDWVWQSPAK